MRTLMGYTSKFLIFIFISVLTAGCATTNSLEAGKAFERGDYNTAIKYYKLCVDKEGDTGKFASHYSFLLGKSYFDKGQYPEAITYLKRAIDIYKKGMYVFSLILHGISGWGEPITKTSNIEKLSFILIKRGLLRLKIQQ